VIIVNFSSSTEGLGAAAGFVSEQLGNFMAEHIDKSNSFKFSTFRRVFASHTCDSAFSKEPDFRKAFADYINTSLAIMMRNYNRSSGVITLRRTQEALHQVIDPVAQTAISQSERFSQCGEQYVNVLAPVVPPQDLEALAPEKDNIDENSEQGQISWIKTHNSPYKMFNFNNQDGGIRKFAEVVAQWSRRRRGEEEETSEEEEEEEAPEEEEEESDGEMVLESDQEESD
jgi:hypothetical protein